MKKFIAFVLSLCIVGGSAPAAVEYLGDISLTASAETVVESGTCGENVTWTLDSEGTLTISGEGTITKMFNNCEEPINSVIIEEGVTGIGSWAFMGCSSIVSVKLPDTLTSIGVDAFNSCTSLISITIPNSVKIIDEWAFYNCRSLDSITILNPTCEINSYTQTISNGYDDDKGFFYFNGTIYGYLNSTAQRYANTRIKFVAIAANGALLGNVNFDTSVDSSDAAMILQHYAVFQSDGAGKFNGSQLAVADYNNDSNIDSSDAALILRAYAENQSK